MADIEKLNLLDGAGIADEANDAAGWLFLEAVGAPREAMRCHKEEGVPAWATVRIEE